MTATLINDKDDPQARILQLLWFLDPLYDLLASLPGHPQLASQCVAATLRTKSEASTRRPRRRRVHFDPDTSVYVIPHHTDYSPKERTLIWTSTLEILRNAQRNRREFSSEGWDWRQVKEEDEMFYDTSTAEYIHPIHLGGLKGML